jgi:hypothetical protein
LTKRKPIIICERGVLRMVSAPAEVLKDDGHEPRASSRNVPTL